LTMLLVLAAGGAGGWYWWQLQEKDRIIAQLERRLDRVWSSSLVADLRVDRLYHDKATGRQRMELTFIQHEPGSERAIFTRKMTLPGDEVYIDALVVTFQRKFVEAGDGLRGKSLILFRRAFSDQLKPSQGVPLYARNSDISLVPEVMRVDRDPSPFERQIWQRFWAYANDQSQAAKVGIRVAQGEAPHVKVVAGQVYKLTLRASGGLEIRPRLPLSVLKGRKRGT
jgi:hypothetical protein